MFYLNKEGFFRDLGSALTVTLTVCVSVRVCACVCVRVCVSIKVCMQLRNRKMVEKRDKACVVASTAILFLSFKNNYTIVI